MFSFGSLLRCKLIYVDFFQNFLLFDNARLLTKQGIEKFGIYSQTSPPVILTTIIHVFSGKLSAIKDS